MCYKNNLKRALNQSHCQIAQDWSQFCAIFCLNDCNEKKPDYATFSNDHGPAAWASLHLKYSFRTIFRRFRRSNSIAAGLIFDFQSFCFSFINELKKYNIINGNLIICQCVVLKNICYLIKSYYILTKEKGSFSTSFLLWCDDCLCFCWVFLTQL